MVALSESDAVVVTPLRASGLVDEAGFERARSHQLQNGGSLTDALLRLNLVRETDFLRVFAEMYSVQYVKADKLAALKLNEELLERVGVRSSERLRMCPIRWEQDGGELHVVAAMPLAANLQAELRQVVGARNVVIYLATPGAVAALIRRSYYHDPDARGSVTANGAGPGLPGRSETAVGPEPLAPAGASYASSSSSAAREVTASSGIPVAPPEHGAAAIANLDAVTITTLRKENARYRVAQEFHRRVSLERSIEEMVDRILTVIFELMNAEGAAIWLATGQFASKAKSQQKAIEVPRSVFDQAMASENGILTHNALVDSRFGHSESVLLRGVQSVMAVRISAPRSGPLGILYVESTSQRAAFTDEDLSLLDSIAAQAAILLDNAALVAQVKKELENRASLSRFLSPAAVEEVLSGRMNLKMEGSAAEVTVLFADIRGFIPLTANMPPEEIVRFLNSFFGEAVDVIEKHHGVVDKFIGDCVMAIWGAPAAGELDARNAVRAALELVDRAKNIRVNDQPLEIGVGLNTGLAVIGAIGGKQRADFTAIGATVNVAARLCGVAGSGEVLISSETLLRAGPGVMADARPPVLLKGLETPTATHRVQSLVEPLKLVKTVVPIPLQQAVAMTGPIPLPLITPVKLG